MRLADVLRDACSICHILVPTAIANGLEYLPVLIGIAFVGHGTSAAAADQLDGLALARTFFNAIGCAPGFGIISGLRTLCPQAVGAGQPKLCAVYLQRAILCVVMWSAPLAVCSLYAERLLRLVGQPDTAARLAQPYVLRLLPSYFGYVGMSAIQRVYQAHDWNYANLLIVLITFACAPPLQWLLIQRCGYLGAAWATSIYTQIYFLLQVPYLIYTGHGYLFVPRRAAFSRRGMAEYLRLTAPGFFTCCLEWWVLESLVLLAGRLRSAEVTIASFLITSQIQSMALMAWIGLAVAASSLVGRRIGAGDVRGARRAALLTPLVGAVLAGVLCAPVAILAPQIARAFSMSGAVDSLTARLLPLVSVVLLLDAISNSLQGICSGLGLQRVAALANMLGYYVIGIPAAVVLAFVVYKDRKEGVFGLWIGVGGAMLTAALLMIVALLRHDWSRSASEAALRLQTEAGSAPVTTGAPHLDPLGAPTGVNTSSSPATGDFAFGAEEAMVGPSVLCAAAGASTARSPLLDSGPRVSAR